MATIIEPFHESYVQALLGKNIHSSLKLKGKILSNRPNLKYRK